MSTNYDEKLSDIISEALDKKGLKGVIHMEPMLIAESSLVVNLADQGHRRRFAAKRCTRGRATSIRKRRHVKGFNQA